MIVEQDGRREQGSSGGGGRFDYGYFTDDVLEDYARKAVHQAVVNLDARPAPAGPMTVVLGPGKADLLEAIAHHGTVRDAAAELGMSYMRAWKLVQTIMCPNQFTWMRSDCAFGRAAASDPHEL